MNQKDARLGGILMPVGSLPSRCGVGSFGKEAYEFVDILAAMGAKIWQILPLNPLSFGNSPYQPYSSYAGDELYIDLDKLAECGLLPKHRPAYRPEDKSKVDFQKVRAFKEPYLRRAYAAFCRRRKKDKAAFFEFCKQPWVYPYGVFIALKQRNGMRCWNEWPREEQDWSVDHKFDLTDLKDEIDYRMFLQYIFYTQWMELKAYANGKGLQIMGDMPFYVGLDSLDVWMGRDNFLLDGDGRPTFIAGVPPDYFSATGQRWGNPIYNWEKMESDGFTFWLERLGYNSKLYDIVRIDHFRAFDTYWKIPASCPTAIDGAWIEAPGYALFDKIYETMPDIQIVAEDLGDLRPEVLVLRDHYHLSGMYVAQFSLPKLVPEENNAAYTGTHDNDTARGWYEKQDANFRRRVARKLRPYGEAREAMSRKMVRFVLASKASVAIVPLFDVLNLGSQARLNTPGTVGSPNWEWRISSFKAVYDQVDWVKEAMQSSGR